MPRSASVETPAEAIRCRLCGALMAPDDERCPACGEPSGWGERKLITLLFADLAGYTALSSALDPEEVYTFIRPVMTQLRLLTESFGAPVPQIAGDGVMAVFGVPTAHEDDAERAVRAALALVRRVRELNVGRATMPFPEVHAGINTGEVLVAGSYEASGFAVMGDAVNVASRLAGVASAGHVVVSERTRRMTEHAIRYGRPKRHRVKGKDEPLAAFEALEPLSSLPEGHVARPRETAFVGRREPMERLATELRTAVRSGRSRLLILSGDPGLGKTRLAAEFRATVPGATVLWGRCPPYERDSPVSALAEAVRAHVGAGADASRGSARAAIRRFARRLADGPDAALLAGQVRLLLGREPARARDAAPRTEEEIRQAARAVVQALAGAGPVVLVLDDLHWADADLVRLLRDAHGTPWEGPILIVGLARPEFAAGEPALPVLRLEPLEPTEARALIGATLDPGLPARVVGRLVDRSAGNPLFIEESVRMLVETDVLARGDDGWLLKDLHGVERVPTTLRALVSARIDALAPAEKRALQDASITGQVTWDRLVEHLSGDPGARRALRALERRDLLIRGPRVQVPRAVEFEFKHILIRDVAYQSLPLRDRANRHRRAGDWLRRESQGIPEEPVAAIATQYEQAWDLSRARTGEPPSTEVTRSAAEYLKRWADQSLAYQPALAERLYSRAVEVARSRWEAAPPALRAELLTGRAESLIVLGRQREAVADARAALELAAAAKREDARARALLALGQATSFLGDVAEARTVLEDALASFRRRRDRLGQARATQRLSETWRLHDYGRHVDLYRRAHALFDQAGDRWGQATVAQNLAYLLTTYGGEGFEAYLAEASAFAEREGDLRARAALARTAAYAALYRGEFGEARRSARSAQPIAADVGDRWVEVDALLVETLVASAVGHPQEALRLAGRIVAIAEEADAPRLRALGVLASVRPFLRAGQATKALRRLAAARRTFEGLGADAELIGVDLTEAALALDRGTWERVAAPASRAEHLAGERGWRLEATLGPVLAGRAALGAGRFDQARRELERARRLARAAGATGRTALASAASAQAAILMGGRPRIPSGAHPDPEIAAIRQENRALLALADGDPEGAAERFRSAIDVWETLGLTSWLARALGFHADALRGAGRRRAADEAAREQAAVRAALAAPRRGRGPAGGDGQPPSARSRKSAAVQENRSAP